MIYEKIGIYFPASFRAEMERTLTFAGVNASAENWLGRLVGNAVAFGLVGFVAAFLTYHLKLLAFRADPLLIGTLAFAVLFAAGIGLTFLLLYYEIRSRTRAIEAYLPDFLELVASNLGAGVSPFDSFRGAARPEFGPLYSEILYVTAKTTGSGSFSLIFRELADRVPSKSLSRVITIFEKGVRSGSKLSKLLAAIADELRTNKEMEDELATSVHSHVIFLVFLLIFVAPFLLAISSQFIRTYKTLSVGADSGPNLVGLQVGGNPHLATLDLGPVFIGLLTVASLLTSMLVGVLVDDDPVFGLKYFPLIAAASIAVFAFSTNGMAALLGTVS